LFESTDEDKSVVWGETEGTRRMQELFRKAFLRRVSQVTLHKNQYRESSVFEDHLQKIAKDRKLALIQTLIRHPTIRTHSENEELFKFFVKEHASLPKLAEAEKQEMLKLMQSIGFCFFPAGSEIYRAGEICQHFFIVI
jgi:hypothetical protein